MKNLLLIIAMTISMHCMGQLRTAKEIETLISDSVNAILFSDVWDIVDTPKDTFIQVRKYLWYNEATWTYLDSSYYYQHIEWEADLAQKYLEYCYADSSILYEWVHYRWNGFNYDTVYQRGQFPMVIESSCEQIPPIYKHQEPSFKGYAEWLNNLLKEQQ